MSHVPCHSICRSTLVVVVVRATPLSLVGINEIVIKIITLICSTLGSPQKVERLSNLYRTGFIRYFWELCATAITAYNNI